MNMRVSKVVNKDGSVELYFEHVGHWDDFDLILGLLQQENDCQILSNQEAIYIREARLRHKDIEFLVNQDDMLGNFISTKKPDDVPILEQLANNVIDSIKRRLADMNQ